MPIISIKKLIHDFVRRDEEGEKIGINRVLDGVELDVHPGEFIAILGHNGSGKSTLAKHINVLLTPTEGQVYVCDLDTTVEKNVIDIRRAAGMVFQNPDNQIIATVVEEDVAFGPENLGIETSEIVTRVNESLQSVDMDKYRYHKPNNLSGGQKQRVAIAGVLAMKPKCIILDEPTAMLDPIGRREVLSVVKKLNKEEGMTVIYVTHHMDEVVDADRIFVMEAGKIALSGSPREIFADVDKIENMGLTVPQATKIASMLKKDGYDMPVVLNPSECAEAILKLKKEVQ